MGTTAEKLTYLNTTKQNLKTVINTTGAGLTDESTFRSYANVLNDKILGAINGDVDLFEEYPKVSGNGTDLSLNGVVEGKMAITPQGVSKQGSTTGKNLFNNTTAYIYSPYLTVTKIDGCTYSITGTTDASREIRIVNGYNNKIPLVILPNGTYKTISYFNNELIASTTSVANGSTYHSSGSSYTIDDDFTGISSIAYRIPAGNYNNAILKIMVVDSNTTDLLYEPYTDGPAPNPSYSYSVKSVTGENSLVICNENLFDKNSSSITNNKRISTSTGGSYSSNGYSISPFIEVKPSTQYNLTSGIQSYYCWYDENEQKISGGTWNTGESKTSPSNVKYVKFDFQTSDIDSIMFVKGATTPSTYVEHQSQAYPLSLGNIELNSSPDGTIRDGIYGSPNGWYKREYIGKVVLDGSESWTFVSNSAMKFSLNINGIAKPVNQNTLPKMLSDNFRQSTWNNAINSDDDYLMVVSTSNEILRIKDNDFSTLADFKAWLSTHNTTIYYPLAQYTDIPITDTTLINQLNDIYNNAHSYNSETNITTTYANGNEQIYLDIEALKNVWEVTE